LARERVYLDWNATTPLRPEARAAMAAAWDAGNPSSVHAEGRAARHLVEEARARVEAAVGADDRNVVFTSGGTEANSLALAPGIRAGSRLPINRLVVSATEHASVLTGGRFEKAAVETLHVTRSGVVDLDHLSELLKTKAPALVSVMSANNETGALQPTAKIAGIVHEAGGLLHVDAVQSFGKVQFDINEIQADLVSLSAHKVGGPKGVGALIIRDGIEGLDALLRGGGQEKGRRAGTENVIGIAGFGAAAEAAMASIAEMATLEKLRKRLEEGLRQTRGVLVFSEDAPRLPNTTLFTAPGLNAETAVIGFDLEGVAVSSGSACSSGRVQASHVLEAMGFGPEQAKGAVRLSLGWSTTEADVDRCLEAWRKLSSALLKGYDETHLERF
jgi:cysteine desulfurase